ncbi:MAG: cytochrome c5 family protein [Pseudomonadales bacterium]|nr:cytochrome c5 family protein [Pseudomonadales bacterium]
MTTAVLALGIYAIPPGTNDEIAERLKPAGSVCRTGEGCGSSAVAVATGSMSGEEIYKQFCFVCHATGVSDAPRLGDTDAWQPRVDKGVETLVTTTLNGLNAMPPKGTCMSCSDDELGSAVTYMLDQL